MRGCFQAGEKVYSAVVKSEVMEGLACPRGATTSPQDRKSALALPLPQVEGLAARFDSYFEKVSDEELLNHTFSRAITLG
jgi:hypothetical protein